MLNVKGNGVTEGEGKDYGRKDRMRHEHEGNPMKSSEAQCTLWARTTKNTD